MAIWGRAGCGRDHSGVYEASLRLAVAGIIVLVLTAVVWAVRASWPAGGQPEVVPRGRYWWEAV
jgi:hypothetical protein